MIHLRCLNSSSSINTNQDLSLQLPFQRTITTSLSQTTTVRLISTSSLTSMAWMDLHPRDRLPCRQIRLAVRALTSKVSTNPEIVCSRVHREIYNHKKLWHLLTTYSISTWFTWNFYRRKKVKCRDYFSIQVRLVSRRMKLITLENFASRVNMFLTVTWVKFFQHQEWTSIEKESSQEESLEATTIFLQFLNQKLVVLVYHLLARYSCHTLWSTLFRSIRL